MRRLPWRKRTLLFGLTFVCLACLPWFQQLCQTHNTLQRFTASTKYHKFISSRQISGEDAHEKIKFLLSNASNIAVSNGTNTNTTNRRHLRILFLVSDHKPPNERVTEMLMNYQKQIQEANYLKRTANTTVAVDIDFYFFCNDNFFYKKDFDNMPCKRAERAALNDTHNQIPYLTLGKRVTRFYLRKCRYCMSMRNGGWAWSGYMAPFLALRHLQILKKKRYDIIWSSETDTEFVGNLVDWLVYQEAQFLEGTPNHKAIQTPPLVSSVVLPSIEAAQQHLQPGMFARIRENWRWYEPSWGNNSQPEFDSWSNRSKINFGTYMHITRFTYHMLHSVEAFLPQSTYVERFLPWVCDVTYGSLRDNSSLSRPCRAASFYYHDVGFFSTRDHVFAGTYSAENFATIASVPSLSHNRWYHPTKFTESWRQILNTTDKKQAKRIQKLVKGRIRGRGGQFYKSKKCLIMDCHDPPLCSDKMTDNCYYIAA